MQIRQEDILSTGHLELLAKHAVEGFITGFHKSPFHGFSVEFAEHRLYNPGESIRNIDWKLYGRTDKLFVKRYEEETNLRCRIIIDASSSMQYQADSTMSKMQYAIWCAAVLLQLLKKQRDATGLDLFDEDIFYSTAIASSSKHYKELLSQLSKRLEYRSERKGTDLPTILHTLAKKMHRRSMIILFTDLLSHDYSQDALFDAIQHLKHNKQEVLIFNTLHRPTEIALDFSNRPVTFEDLETGEKVKMLPHEVKTVYQQQMDEHLKTLKLKCSQYKVDLHQIDSSKGIEQAIIPFLVKRSRMTR